jgi:hypothetical protein
MPITMNKFKCSNGHSFEANAKLRTRCPECGSSTRRSFVAAVIPDVIPKEDPPEKEEAPKVEVKPVVHKAGPVLIKQGRPRMAAAKKSPPPKKPAPPKRGPIGSKVAAGLVSSTTIKKRGVLPTIKRRPIKTAPARGVVGHTTVAPYWHSIADKYGI